ncbi:hypothetical protein DKM44_03165 [Deinococcus irradiatisoli]|uniref:DUF3325 domain-containing protein n=1 Tax=Deinococcus irradiatisoli TaxID=2202254 RepID=A0A2Z3JKB2_9DEIO|nr:hypothetical protein [Deinococcus irradiatisoli]AWN22358.1 hypothetical protein DKM44_03165 [Deinococcus irradiatisoli]
MEALLRVLLLLAGVLLAWLMLLGLRLQLGAAPRRRWLHHLLFFVVSALSVVATAVCALTGRRFAVLACACLLLLLMPLTRPGRSAHWQLALAASVTFVLGAGLAW